MANGSWFNPNSGQPFDPSTFNYDTEAQALARKRAIANALQQSALEGDQRGQFVQSPMGTFYSGGNTLGTTLARLATAALAAKQEGKLDDAQSQLAQHSNAALAWALDPANSPAGQAAAAQQAQTEADASDAREQANMQSGAAHANDVAPTPDTSYNPAQDSEVTSEALAAMPQTSSGFGGVGTDPSVSDTPVISPHVAAKAIKALSKAKAPAVAPVSSQQAAAKALAAMPFDSGVGDDWDSTPAPADDDQGVVSGIAGEVGDQLKSALGNALKKGAQWFVGADDQQPAVQQAAAPQAPAAPVANAPATPQAAPGASPAAPATPMLPKLGGPLPSAPQAAPQPQAPQAAPQQAPAQQPQAMPQQDNPYASLPLTQQAAIAAGNAPHSTSDTIAELTRIAQTGPMGQQIATAKMNQMFASKNGRFETKIMADPVNGGFVQVTTDTATGQTLPPQVINAGGGKLVTGQTTDAQGNRLNVHKDGSTSPMLDAQGNPVKDSSVTARNDDQTLKVGAAVQSNQNAQAAIDAAINRNNRILELYHQTYTGPIGGLIPNGSDARQELHALLAQDLFAETRNALAGAGDAGGAPRMAQSEFKYMKDNGGLSQTTSEHAAENIIANMNAQLMRQKAALQEYGSKLASAGSPSVGAPARGQTFNGPNAAAASLLGLGGQQ